MNSVLITGGAGYLGAVLTEQLLKQDFEVTVLDSFMYQQRSLSHLCRQPRLRIVCGDARCTFQLRSLLKYADVVVALAALVGAPACERDPGYAQDLNVGAIRTLSRLLASGQMLIYPNTNSGYGVGGEQLCTEDTPLNPISTYGRTKVTAEADVLAHPHGISLRFATLFGASARMRLDLIVNDFVYRAVRDRYLVLFEEQYRRNFLHVLDAAGAIIHIMEISEPAQRVFNVGDSRANMTKRELAQRVAEHVGNVTLYKNLNVKDPDQRDYIVSNERLMSTGWRPAHTIDQGIEELIRCYQQPFEAHRNA